MIFLSSTLVIWLVAINFSLANCELNYTPFVYLGDLPQFKETIKVSTLIHWLDWPGEAKVLNNKLCI